MSKPSRRRTLRLESLEPRVVPTVASDRFVSALFPELLHRQADPGGRAYFAARLDAGASRQQVVREFESSVEYRTIQVDALYQDLLQRPSDAGGRSAFVSLLGGGAGLERARALLASSDEYINRRAGGNVGGFVDVLYQDALGRAADAPSRAAYTSAILSGALSRSAVADAVFGSAEARNRVIGEAYEDHLLRDADAAGRNGLLAALNGGAKYEDVVASLVGSEEFYALKVDQRGTPTRALVEQLYQDLLGRIAGPGDLAAWVPKLDQGLSAGAVASGILSSLEYRNGAVARLYQDMLRRPADAGGQGSFVSMLGAGMSLERVKATMAASDEYINRRGGTLTAFVDALYQDATGRPADASGRAFYVDSIRYGDLTRSDVARTFFEGAEAAALQVQSAYRQVLRRSADGGGLRSLVSRIVSGGSSTDVFTILAGSQEYGNVIGGGQAVTFAGSGVAVFDSPQGGTTTGAGTTFFTWGEPAEEGGSVSTLRFFGRSFSGAAPGETFELGSMTYFNGVTDLGTETAGVDLRTTLTLNGLPGVGPQEFTFGIDILSTENDDDPIRSSDALFLRAPSSPAVLTTPDGRQYTLRLAGFGRVSSQGAQTIDHFYLGENGTANVSILAQLVPTTPAVSVTISRLSATTAFLTDDMDFRVGTSPGATVDSYGIQFKRVSEPTWTDIQSQGLGTAGDLRVRAKMGGYFEYRGYAVVGGVRYYSPKATSMLEIRYPDASRIIAGIAKEANGSDPSVRSSIDPDGGTSTVFQAMQEEWARTEEFAQANPSLRQERGFVVYLDPDSGLYSLLDRNQFAVPVNANVSGTVSLRLPNGLRGGDTFRYDAPKTPYVLASFHTHSSSAFRNVVRGTGPSTTDKTTMAAAGYLGFVFDYNPTGFTIDHDLNINFGDNFYRFGDSLPLDIELLILSGVKPTPAIPPRHPFSIYIGGTTLAGVTVYGPSRASEMI